MHATLPNGSTLSLVSRGPVAVLTMQGPTGGAVVTLPAGKRARDAFLAALARARGEAIPPGVRYASVM